jgi:hypothetical protein
MLRLESWQRRARDWQTKRQRELLLTGVELRHAQRRAGVVAVSPAEQEFLKESAVAERDRSIVERSRSSMGRLRALVLVLLLINVVLAVLLIRS